MRPLQQALSVLACTHYPCLDARSNTNVCFLVLKCLFFTLKWLWIPGTLQRKKTARKSSRQEWAIVAICRNAASTPDFFNCPRHYIRVIGGHLRLASRGSGWRLPGRYYYCVVTARTSIPCNGSRASQHYLYDRSLSLSQFIAPGTILANLFELHSPHLNLSFFIIIFFLTWKFYWRSLIH